MHQNHLEGLLKYELMGPLLRVSDTASMGEFKNLHF